MSFEQWLPESSALSCLFSLDEGLLRSAGPFPQAALRQPHIRNTLCGVCTVNHCLSQPWITEFPAPARSNVNAVDLSSFGSNFDLERSWDKMLGMLFPQNAGALVNRLMGLLLLVHLKPDST